MKVTDNYIKMCEGALEMQKAWEPQDGDWVANKLNSKWNITLVRYSGHECYRDHFDDPDGEGAFGDNWLPLQHQLQGMVRGKQPFFMDTLFSFYEEFIIGNSDYIERFKSPEELWLAFVMKEKYSKLWSPEREEWING